MQEDASLARNKTAAATAAGSPGRPAAIRALTCSRYPGGYVSVISLLKKPGAMALTGMPFRPVHCWARSRVSPIRPALLAEYAACGSPLITVW